MKKLLAGITTGLLMICLAGTVSATPTYVGSWQVDQGPDWDPAPAIYSGLQAAAHLFGGNPSDYSISTVDNNPAHINHMAWYSAYGSGGSNIAPILPNGQGDYPAGSMLLEGTIIDANGNGLYDWNYDTNSGDYSAYIFDWAVGPIFTNYAFKVQGNSIPEPATMLLFGAGLAGLAVVRRKKA